MTTNPIPATRPRAQRVEALLPEPGPQVTVPCRLCAQPFETESVVWKGGAGLLTPSHATICDDCAALEGRAKSAMVQDAPTTEERRRLTWMRMVGTRYAEFRRDQLPPAIEAHAERVLAWTPQPRGIGLLGPPRTGKSPLIFGLAQQLHVAGHDVFPTSGIEFQRQYLRGIEDRPTWERFLKNCENSAILLLDDADKLNLTPGVEAEYYGMLEHRRNWQLPVLATLNLAGDQIKELARDRHDRATAIVERLRDLCEFIAV